MTTLHVTVLIDPLCDCACAKGPMADDSSSPTGQPSRPSNVQQQSSTVLGSSNKVTKPVMREDTSDTFLQSSASLPTHTAARTDDDAASVASRITIDKESRSKSAPPVCSAEQEATKNPPVAKYKRYDGATLHPFGHTSLMDEFYALSPADRKQVSPWILYDDGRMESALLSWGYSSENTGAREFLHWDGPSDPSYGDESWTQETIESEAGLNEKRPAGMGTAGLVSDEWRVTKGLAVVKGDVERPTAK